MSAIVLAVMTMLGCTPTHFEDGTECVLQSRNIVVSVWVADRPNLATPDSFNLNVLVVL